MKEKDLEVRAVQALKRLLKVKDASIRAFTRAFIGNFDDVAGETEILH